MYQIISKSFHLINKINLQLLPKINLQLLKFEMKGNFNQYMIINI